MESGTEMMEMEPLISVIVPIYQVEAYLCQCVDSILAQTHKNLEIILVDDGSKDRCPEICDKYVQKDDRIKVIHKMNGGLSDARNAGLEIATGDYIGFVDSDDWLMPDMFEYLLQGILGYGVDISYCNYINMHGTWMDHSNEQTDKVYTRETALNELFFDRLKNFAWNKLYKAELWQDVRFPFGRNFEDILTIYKVFEKAKRIAILKEAKYYYRIRNDGITREKGFLNRWSIYTAIIDRYKEIVPRLPQYRAALFRHIRNWYMHELSNEIVYRPELRVGNMILLHEMAPFVASCKDELAEELSIDKWERRKWDAFSEGTIEGCKKTVYYHRKMEKARAQKKKWKKILKL